MENSQEIREKVVQVLGYVEKVSSFAESINPLFGIVTSLVKVVRKGLVAKEDNELANDFKQIQEKLDTISVKNTQTLQQIRINEVIENYGPLEEKIKHQYHAFKTMIEEVKRHPDNAEKHMQEFQKVYEKDQRDKSLNTYYEGVAGQDSTFGSKILGVYLEACNHDRGVMEAKCSHIAHIFHIGLISLMAYNSILGEEEEKEAKEKWTERVAEIQAKMDEVLKGCAQKN